MTQSTDRWIVFDMISKKVITRNPVIFANAKNIQTARILKKQRAPEEVRIVRSVQTPSWVKRRINLELIK